MHFRATCIAISALVVSALALPSLQSVGSESANEVLGASNSAISHLESRQAASFKSDVVNRHNTYRGRYGAPPLTWSDALYPATQQWANSCKFQHSGGNYGENLAAGTGSYGFPAGLDGWMAEASKYNYNNPGFSPDTGHFTQVVWKGTRQVACAVANCGAGTIFSQPSVYVVCRYNPAGNVLGQFPQNVGRPTS